MRSSACKQSLSEHAWSCRQENEVAIDLITEHIRMKLQQPELRRIYHNLELMPSNFQIRGMHTLIRDRTTSKADFVFYADRLLRLVRRLHLPSQESQKAPSIWQRARQLAQGGHDKPLCIARAFMAEAKALLDIFYVRCNVPFVLPRRSSWA